MKTLKYIIIGVIGLMIGTITFIASAQTLRVITVPSGGTGASTLSGCLSGNGTSPITGSGSACGSGGTWSTTTSQVSGRLINYPNNATDIVTIGSTATTTAKFYFDPNLNMLSIGNTVMPQLSAFGTGYYQLQMSNNVDDVIASQYINRSTGTSAASCMFFGGDRMTLGGIGALANYYGGLCYGNSQWNVPGFNALRPNGMVLYSTDGPLTIGSGSTNTASSSIYFQAGSGLDASYDMTLTGGTGRLGISTTSPYAKLSVTNTGSEPSFVVEDSTSPDTTPFMIDSSGNVGIGTASPTTKLNIAGDVAFSSANHFTSSPGFVGRFTTQSTNSGIFPAFTKNLIGRASVTDWTIAGNTPDVYQGIVYELGGMNFFAAAGAFNADDVVTPVTRLYIKNDGNVGIGTTTPESKFTVTSGASATTTIQHGTYGDATSKVCYNTKNSAGGRISYYFVGITQVIENNACK